MILTMCWGPAGPRRTEFALYFTNPALADSSHLMSVSCTGTTVTAILSIGPLLTVANTGDSSAILDTGSSTLEMTKSHRIHDSLEEQTRLKSAGCYLAPWASTCRVQPSRMSSGSDRCACGLAASVCLVRWAT